MNSRKIRRITVGGMLAALVAVLTAYVSVPIAGGYFHPGDAMIALSSAILGPYAAIPAAIGSGFADMLAGYTIYAPFTFVIKGLVGLVAGMSIRSGKIGIKTAALIVISGIIIPAGYFATDLILYGFATAIASVAWNCLQAAICIATSFACRGKGLKRFFERI